MPVGVTALLFSLLTVGDNFTAVVLLKKTFKTEFLISSQVSMLPGRTGELKQRHVWGAYGNWKEKKLFIACLDVNGSTERPPL